MIALIAGPTTPPRSVQGLGLPYLAAALEDAGFEVGIFDVYPPSTDTNDPAVLDERLAEVVARHQPSMVGVTIHTPAYAERVHLAKCLRQRLPEALLVAGGHHPTAEPRHLLRNSDFDVCVVGEGEQTVVEIARRTERRGARGRIRALGDVRGLVYKHDGRILRTDRCPPVADLDAMPFQAHHLLGLDEYAPHPLLGIKSTGIVTYRGCPMRCAFCNNPLGRRVRKRSPTAVAEEMARVVEGFGVRGFNCYDNLLGLDRGHALAVCDAIRRRKLDVVWECWTAGDLVDAELAESMRSAGCVQAGFGAESGDNAVLLRARRGFTTEQHLGGIRALKTAGLAVSAFFMVGLPGESAESVRRTVELAKRCGADDLCLSVHRPFPGTAVWRDPGAFGVRVVRGPNFEAYVETEHLPRAAILSLTQWAGEDLKRAGLKSDFLRCDQYPWER